MLCLLLSSDSIGVLNCYPSFTIGAGSCIRFDIGGRICHNFDSVAVMVICFCRRVVTPTNSSEVAFDAATIVIPVGSNPLVWYGTTGFSASTFNNVYLVAASAAWSTPLMSSLSSLPVELSSETSSSPCSQVKKKESDPSRSDHGGGAMWTL